MIKNTCRALIFRLCTASVGCAAGGCALTSKAELVEIRYFSPERMNRANQPQVTAPANANTPWLIRLGRVSSGPNLRERIAHRDAPYELGYYDDLRWTERPEIYVRRALSRELFERQGLRHAVGGLAPTLDIEVLAFDDLRIDETRAARVQLRATLYDDTEVIFERTLYVDQPVSKAKPRIEDFVEAMAAALDTATQTLAAHIRTALGARSRVTTPEPTQ